MIVKWWPEATDDLLALPPNDAAVVDRGVQDFATSGLGLCIADTDSPGTFLLVIGAHTVVWYLDDTTQPSTMNIASVRANS
jgi:hypothetical protein